MIKFANTENHGKENETPLALAPPPTTEIQTILATITNFNRPPPPPPKPQTNIKKILVFLTTNTNGGGGNNGDHNNNVCNPPKVGMPNPQYKFYCWSHGVNPTHDSCGLTTRNLDTRLPVSIPIKWRIGKPTKNIGVDL